MFLLINSTSKDVTKKSPKWSEALGSKVYRRHLYGARVRSLASLFMCFFSFPAYAAGFLAPPNMYGITASVLYLLLINHPLLYWARRIGNHMEYNAFSITVLALEILGYTSVIHFVGGIDAAYLLPIYCVLITYVGMLAPVSHTWIAGIFSIVSFDSMALLEHVGLLANYAQGTLISRAFILPFHVKMTVLAAASATLIVVTFVCVRIGGRITSNGKRIRRQNQELSAIRLVLEEKVTTLEATEMKLQSLLNDKEILLKEIHHRVKNNLSTVCAILQIQSCETDDSNVAAALNEGINRITAMAAIHEVAYRSELLSQMRVKDYLNRLIETLSGSRMNPIFRIFVRDDFYLSVDIAVPCGLAMNELITNALKYAFPEGRLGVISILGERTESCVKIIVADDGIGIPASFDWRKSESLGLQLVSSMIERQLGGTIILDATRGTRWELAIPNER